MLMYILAHLLANLLKPYFFSAGDTKEKKKSNKCKKPIRKRIIIMSSSSDSSGSESDNGNASFDIGAIKKKYATPAATAKKGTKTREISIEKDNEYDLEDSFIDDNDDDSESDFSSDQEVRYNRCFFKKNQTFEVTIFLQSFVEETEEEESPKVVSKPRVKETKPKNITKKDSFIDDDSESETVRYKSTFSFTYNLFKVLI